MLVLKGLICFVFLTVFAFDASAESIAGTAAKIAKVREQKAELEKDKVKAGETIDDIGDLSIDDFLELDAVPDGVGAVTAQTLTDAPERFNFMTQAQTLQSIAVLRKQGIALPDDLEENIKNNPEKASELLIEAFEKIPPADVKDKNDISSQRKAVIKEAESNLGIQFRDILEQQKLMMTPSSKGRRRGKKINNDAK